MIGNFERRRDEAMNMPGRMKRPSQAMLFVPRLKSILLARGNRILTMEYTGMLRILMTGAALALAAPALAQDQQIADPAATPATSGQADPTAAAASANAPAQVASVVESEFPVYDADKSGQLDQNEFSRWMLALKDQEMKSTGKAMPQQELTAWASSAFTTADADKSSTVTKAELTQYLGG